MQCNACGSTALVEGKITNNDGSKPAFYPNDVSRLAKIFALGGRAVRAYGCLHCQNLQLAVDFTEEDIKSRQHFEGVQPDLLERINAEPEKSKD
jgi:hypothetical protein